MGFEPVVLLSDMTDVLQIHQVHSNTVVAIQLNHINSPHTQHLNVMSVTPIKPMCHSQTHDNQSTAMATATILQTATVKAIITATASTMVGETARLISSSSYQSSCNDIDLSQSRPQLKVCPHTLWSRSPQLLFFWVEPE